jgi:hypothetical protein
MPKIRERSMFPRFKSHLRHTRCPKNHPPSLICQKSKQLKCLRFVCLCVCVTQQHARRRRFLRNTQKTEIEQSGKKWAQRKMSRRSSSQSERAVQRVDMRESNTKLLFKTPRASRCERGGKKQAPTTYTNLTD